MEGRIMACHLERGAELENLSPEVSVIMPCFNDEAYIEDTVRSVLNQSMTDFELIVVDDGSSDQTVSAVAAMAERDSRIRLLRSSGNQGPAIARNIGVEESIGRFIAFLDSDDLWTPEKLSTQLRQMKVRHVAFSYTLFELIDERGAKFAAAVRLPAVATYRSLLTYCFIRTSSVVYDSAQVGKVYFPDLRKRQDFGLFLQLLRRTGRAELIDECLCSYRIRDDSVSSHKGRNVPYQWAVYRQVEGFSFAVSIVLMAVWFLRAGQVSARRRLQKLQASTWVGYSSAGKGALP